jgi:chitinase
MKALVSAMLLSTSLYGQWVIGHYAAQNGYLPVSNIPWSKYTHINHFAAAPNADGTVDPHYITQAEANQINATKPAGKKVLVCIKDNDGNFNAFSQSTAPGTVGTFVTNIVNFVNTNQYDGVDIDWELNVNITQYNDLLSRLRAALPNKVIAIDAGNWGGLNSVAANSQSVLDQINIMCYDMDSPAFGYSWYNDALTQNGNYGLTACDWRVRAFTGAGVAPGKIGLGIPFYGRRWSAVTRALVNGNFNPSTVFYRDLASDTTRWQPQYQFYDSAYKSNYLAIPNLNEFDSYNGPQFFTDAVAWQKSQGFGGFMTFTVDYEYLSTQTGDARYPLSTALYNAIFFGK